MTAVTIVAFGDSITEASHQPIETRWPEMLRLALQNHFPQTHLTIINAGVGGNTSREGLARIAQDVLRYNPQFVIAEFGNDATPDRERRVSFDEFTANLGVIKQTVTARANAQLILLVFPPIIDAWHTAAFPFLTGWRDGGQDAFQENYRELTRRFGATHQVPLVDIDRALRNAMAKDGPEEYILPDGVHLTAQGNRLVAEMVMQVLAEELANWLAGKGPEGNTD